MVENAKQAAPCGYTATVEFRNHVLLLPRNRLVHRDLEIPGKQALGFGARILPRASMAR